MTTYGALMRQAARLVHAGAMQTTAHPFDDVTQAYLAVASFHGLLDAIERHVWSLVDPSRSWTIYGTSSPRPGADPVEYAAVRMILSIPGLEDKDHRRPSAPRPINHPWADASRALGAARDLLATHTDDNGMARSPDSAVVWDSSARRRALGRVADLAGALMGGSETLGLRAGQAGAHWSNVRRWLPAFDESRAWAATAVHRAQDRTGAGPLDDIGLANPPIRTTDAHAELTDRITRLRRSAWTSLTHPDFSLTTLHDFAGVGLAVNAHCAAFYGINLRHVTDSPGLAQVPQIVRARAWQRVLGDLHDVISPGPGDPTVRADAMAVRRLLPAIAPLVDRTARDDPNRELEHRAVGEVLNGAAETMAQVAGWNATTYDRLARSGHVRIRAANLTGEQITDLPEYAAAKLRGVSVTVTRTLHQRTLAHYGTAAERVSTTSSAPHEPPTRASGEVVEPLAIGRSYAI